MSVQNLETNDVLNLVKGDTVILGRHTCGVTSKYVSRKQVKISLLHDGRCFIQKFKRETWMKVHDINVIFLDEVEVENGDIMEFVDNVKFRFDLPPLPESITRNIAKVNSDQDESTDEGEEYIFQSDNEDPPSNRYRNNTRKEQDKQDSYYDDDDDNFSMISSESSKIDTGSP